jgi:fructosamine-3-kinase
MFPREARGLAWIAEAGALRVPEVLAVSNEADDAPAFLALAYLVSGRRQRGFDEALGRGLAELHRFGAPEFGLDHGNFIGSLSQRNGAWPSWHEFYQNERLQPLLDRALAQGLAEAGLAHKFERLYAKLPDLCGPPEPPARLHGDLWGGNLHVDEDGAPVLIDPAVYGGHREVDLAMMRLFGGFGADVFAAYRESYPLASGHADRVPLYQLYPLMVHVNLFGPGYLGGVERALGRYI